MSNTKVSLVKAPVVTVDTPKAERLVKTANDRLVGVEHVVRAADGQFVVTRIDPRTKRLVLRSLDAQWAGPRLVARSPRTVHAVVQFGKVAKASKRALEVVATREATRKAMIANLVAFATA